MNEIIQNITGMGGMTDQVIATDLLVSVKSGIKNYAAALTETATPELRETLRNHLNTAIDSHQSITDYMVSPSFRHDRATSS